MQFQPKLLQPFGQLSHYLLCVFVALESDDEIIAVADQPSPVVRSVR